MNARTAERVDGWSSRSFTGGYGGLRDLADEEFSGVVETDEGAWLCMLNGKVIGVFDGRIEDFEDASGTTYDAPEPAVPLLVAMQERGGSLEEQYYTKDAPISEADRTLSSGSFVGYIELSENILSGDYHVCYYGGRSMPIAFVGNSEELVTGDEAFEKADDEVGIYNVYSVDMEVVDIPGNDGDGSESADGDPATAETNGGGVAEAGYEPETDRREDEPETTAPGGETGSREDARAGRSDRTGSGEARTRDESGGREPGGEAVDDPYGSEYDERSETADVDDILYGDEPGGRTESGRQTGDGPGRERDGPGSAPSRGSTSDGSDDVDRSSVRDDPGTTPSAGSSDTRGDADVGRNEDRPTDRQFGDGGKSEPDRSASTVGGGVDEIAFETLREQVRDHEQTIEVLKGQLSAAKREHDRLEERHDQVEGETDRLADSVEGLESNLQETVGTLESDLQDLYRRVDRMEDQLGAIERIERRLEEMAAGSEEPAGGEDATESPPEATTDTDAPGDSPAGTERSAAGGVDLSAREALRKTNLLVRYDSKGRATLETAHAGNADRDDVDDNLRLDTHTSFDEGTATVEGQSFDAFLHDRIEYEFTEWLVRDLPYEIRDTGNADALADLYDALPEIDRIEMDAELEVPVDDESGDVETLTFDVVVRDKSGRPLVVANFNDSRDPATEEMVVHLEESARKLRAASDLRAALLVTKSYFAPDALETVEEATGGSLLSRDSKKSYVKLSRKRGYHLCLVESRDGDFHVNVPEL
jgi:hypothetical protein